jgi:hypothetical protein
LTRSENERLAIALNIRGEFAINEALSEMEKQIVRTIGVVRTAQIAEALSDRELATLELWAGDEHEAIANEVKNRRTEYEKFVSRLGERPKPEAT